MCQCLSQQDLELLDYEKNQYKKKNSLLVYQHVVLREFYHHQTFKNKPICVQCLLSGIEYSEPDIHDFQCPISKFLTVDPVTTNDGFTYDRKALVSWLTTNPSSPMTRDPIVKIKYNYHQRNQLQALLIRYILDPHLFPSHHDLFMTLMLEWGEDKYLLSFVKQGAVLSDLMIRQILHAYIDQPKSRHLDLLTYIHDYQPNALDLLKPILIKD